MLHLNYTKDGEAIGDDYAESFLKKAYAESKKGDVTKDISTENVINAVRAMICREEIKKDDVQIYFNMESIPLLEGCKIHYWPQGFCDHTEKWFSDIFTLQLRLKKNKG